MTDRKLPPGARQPFPDLPVAIEPNGPDGYTLIHLDTGERKAYAIARPHVQGWRDIATAPKDGTTILVGASDWIAVSNSFIDGRWWTLYPPMFGSRPTRSNGRAEPPTHWMPLPNPPAPKGAKKR